jgi:hypothetical protein
MSDGKSTSSCVVVVAASCLGPLNFELADVHGLIKQICVTSKHVTSDP